MRKIQIAIVFRSVYQIDMKFDRQLWPATKTSWVVSYGGLVVKQLQDGGRPPFRKSDRSPYLSEKSSDFHDILYTAADFELDEVHVVKNEKVALDRLRVRQNILLLYIKMSRNIAEV